MFVQGGFKKDTWFGWLLTLFSTVSDDSALYGKDFDVSALGLSFVLFFVHVCRRLYENFCVSVFSEGTKITLFQYVWGLVYYTWVPLTLFSGFTNIETGLIASINISSLLQLVGVLSYAVGSLMQHDTFIKLANLRTEGRIKKDSHGIAYGLVFDFVSCPHYLGEILIYFGLLLTAAQACPSLRILFLYNMSAHALMAKSVHHWYMKTFPLYPKNRFALLPFLL